MNRFTGRVAFITGASRGIGKEIAEAYAKEGASVCLVDVNKETLFEACRQFSEKGYTVRGEIADVSKREQVNDAVNNTLQAFGKIDILVNNAGVTRDNLLFKMTDLDWNTVMEVHLKGAFICSQIVQQHMVEKGYGRIINISSTAALGNRGQANYSTAKAGLQGFTKTLAIELGKFGVTANCIAPGFIESDMTKALAERIDADFEEYKKLRAAAIPVNRVGKPKDIANAALFFAMEESSFINGQVLYVAGGPRT